MTRIAVIGAGWAGLAAAVSASAAGHHVVVVEATHAVGGRARAVASQLPDGTPVTLDNGQHILIGAYSETLRLLAQVGVDPTAALLRLPLTLRFPDDTGLQFPRWPAPLDALGAIIGARGWRTADKWGLLLLAGRWQRQGFTCDANASVTQLCKGLSPRVLADLIEPLCISALNTPAHEASAQVFLRVMQDALFGAAGSSHLLLPRVDLSTLFPAAAARHLLQRGAELRLGERVNSVLAHGSRWQVDGEPFDAVIVASNVSVAERLLARNATNADAATAQAMQHWCALARGVRFEAIATVFAWQASAALSAPMVSLRTDRNSPAQFVFDRARLGGPQGLLAFVVSASQADRATLQAQVLQQARTQLGLNLQAVQTIVERRATFACTPGLQRPTWQIAPALMACGDYVAGPYPATLEGAVRSGVAAAAALSQS